MLWQKFKDLIDDKILRHFRESHHPLAELGLASAVGLFWAFTPLVGVQMILVTLNWFLFRIFRLHFHLVIAVAWVWLSNPVTMGPLYYAFYMTGYYFFLAVGTQLEPMTFAHFTDVLTEAQQLGMWNGMMHWGRFMIFELGWPMLIGGFVIAVPVAVAGYPLTVYFMRKYRKRRAAQMGISYEEWEEQFVLKRGEAARFEAGAESEQTSPPKNNAVAKAGSSVSQ